MRNLTDRIADQISNFGACTHAGIFHADDVFSAALLRMTCGLTPERLHRVARVPDSFEGLVFDIGGGQYDHHQTNAEVRPNGIKYAAFGLLCRDILPTVFGGYVTKALDPFIMDIDEMDNNGRLSRTGEANPVSVMVKDFTPAWDEDQSAEAVDAAFWRAVDFADGILRRKIERAQALERAALAVKRSVRLNGTKGSVVMLDTFVPWREYATQYDKAAVYPSLRGGFDLAVRDSRELTLPENWLQTKPEGCTFVHPGRFMAAFRDRSSATAAAINMLAG